MGDDWKHRERFRSWINYQFDGNLGEAAEAIGVTRAAVYNWHKGVRNPSDESVRKMRDAGFDATLPSLKLNDLNEMLQPVMMRYTENVLLELIEEGLLGDEEQLAEEYQELKEQEVALQEDYRRLKEHHAAAKDRITEQAREVVLLEKKLAEAEKQVENERGRVKKLKQMLIDDIQDV